MAKSMPKPKKTIQLWRASPLHLTDAFMVSSDYLQALDDLATSTSATSRLTTQYRSSEVIHGLPASSARRLAPQTVNNFAAHRSASPVSDGPWGSFPLSVHSGCPRRRASSANDQSSRRL